MRLLALEIGIGVPAYNVKTYGAKGDGATDDSVAIQAAVTAAGNGYASDGKVRRVYFDGIFKISSTISVPSGVYLYLGDSTIDYSAVAGTFTAFQALGTMAGGYAGSTAIALTANAVPGDLTVQVASSAGVSVGDWVQVFSQAVNGAGNQKIGEWVHVASTTSTSITFTSPLNDTYNVSDSAGVNKGNPVEHVYFSGGHLKGPTNTSLAIVGISIRWVRDFSLIGVSSLNAHNEHVEIISSWEGRISGCQFEVAELAATAYGASIGYCSQDITITGCTSRMQRHFVTIGGGTSWPGTCRRIVVVANSVFESLDAGLDCHAAGHDIVYANNLIEGVGTAGIGGNTDGIMFQGSSGIISGNTIRNVGGNGIVVQPLTNYAHAVQVVNNKIHRAGTQGIYVDNSDSYPTFASLTIANNDVRNCGHIGGNASIQVGANTNLTTNITNFSVKGNTVSSPSGDGIDIRMGAAGAVADNVVEVISGGANSVAGILIYGTPSPSDILVTDNMFKALGATNNYGIHVLGGANCIITGNRVKGTLPNGIVLDNSCSRCVVLGNHVRDCTTPLNLGTGTNHISAFNYHDQSNAVASAATVTLPQRDNSFEITGTTTITSITASYTGRIVTLAFTGALTVSNGSNLILNGDYATTANQSVLTLWCDGTNWREACRSTGFVTASGTATLTNKRVVPRVETLADAATVTPAADSNDGGKLLTLSQATTIANPTGTPNAFQRYVLRITSASSQTLAWGNQFRGSVDFALPASTSGGGLTDYYQFQWDADSSTWDFVGQVRGF